MAASGIDWTISLGNMISTGVALTAVIGAYYRLKGDVRVLKHDLNNTQTTMELMSDTLKSVNETLTKVAVQDNRLLHIEEDIRDMKRGKGFVDFPPK